MDKKKAEGLNSVYYNVCEIIGFENTVKIYDLFCGSQINFPTRLYSREYVYKQALEMYDGTVESLNVIATKYGYSERTIRKMLQEKNVKE